jgi:hypothetical protein
VLARSSPPDDQRSIHTAFTIEATYFVKDRLLADWDAHGPTSPEVVKGTAADRLLIEKGKAFCVPIITNEGSRPSGVVEDKLRKRAREAGVVAVTPKEFCVGKIENERALIDDFLSRFRQLTPERVRNGPPHRPELLKRMHDYYSHVLLDTVDGGDALLPAQ